MRGKKVDFTPALHLLGKVPDHVVAEKLGCSIQSVQKKRARDGIPACKRYSYDFASVAHLFGKVPDKELADKLGCSGTAIATERKRRGIPAFTVFAPKEWGHLFGVVSDAEIGRRAGVSKQVVQRARVLQKVPTAPRQDPVHLFDFERYGHLLGVVPDPEVVRRSSCSLETVKRVRCLYHIPRPPPSKLDWRKYDHLIQSGKMNDREVAKEIGCSFTAVRNRRIQLGIPPRFELSRRVPQEVKDRVVDLIRSGMPVREAAAVEKVSFRTVYSWLEVADVAPPTRGHSVKYKVTLKKKGIALYESGLSLSQVGKKLGVRASTVRRWLVQDGVPRRAPAVSNRGTSYEKPVLDYMRRMGRPIVAAELLEECGITHIANARRIMRILVRDGKVEEAGVIRKGPHVNTRVFALRQFNLSR